jgi:transcriptional regulator with XRE-family HTH domain
MSKEAYNRIKAVLAEKSVTNKELAEALGKGMNTVSRWCTNENQPPIDTLYEIAEYLDVSVYELLVDNKKK